MLEIVKSIHDGRGKNRQLHILTILN